MLGLDRYAAAVIGDGPYCYWRLGDSGSGYASDQSGSGRSGAYQSAVSGLLAGSPRPGRPATFFNGASAYVGSNFIFNSAHASVECAIRLQALPPTYDTPIMGFWNGFGTFVTDKVLHVRPDGTLDFYIFDGAAKYAISTNRLVVGKSYHILAAADGTNLLIYVNGELWASAAAGNSYTGYTVNNFFVGGGSEIEDSGNPTVYVNASICEAAIYAYALSATQGAEHAAACFQTVKSPLKRRHRLVNSTLSQNLNVPLVAAATTLYAPTLQPGAATISAPYVAPGTVLYGPTMAYTQNCPVPLIAATTQLFAPTLYDEASAVGDVSASIDLG